MDDFFSYISKTVIVIPIIILLLALIFKFNQPKETIFPIKQPITKINTNKPKIDSQKINLDFVGPYKCFYKDSDIEARIYIKNKNVLAEVDREGVTKKYLLSPYVSIAESLIKSNFSGIESMANQYMKRKIDIIKIIDSCKKENFDEKIFNLK